MTESLLVAVAFYCIEFPTYLVNPPFAPAINIPGDELVQAMAPQVP